MNFISFLLSDSRPIPDWIANSFPIIQTILIIVVALLAIVVIVAVLQYPTNANQGNNVVTGTTDSYFSQNQGGTKEGRLKKLIIICSITIFVLTVLYFISFGIYNGFNA